jgi:hypothetical protein
MTGLDNPLAAGVHVAGASDGRAEAITPAGPIPDVLALALAAGGLAHAAVAGGGVLAPAGLAAACVALGLMPGRRPDRPSPIGAGARFLPAGAAAWFGPPGLVEPVLVVAVAARALLLARIAAALLRAGARPPLEIPFAPPVMRAAALVWLSGLSA